MVNEDKVDDAVLTLLWLTLQNERGTWKGFDWETRDCLDLKGLIGDPVNKSKSLVLTDEGRRRAARHPVMLRLDLPPLARQELYGRETGPA